jgi:hypothetical protein
MESSPKKLANAPRGSHPGFWKKQVIRTLCHKRKQVFARIIMDIRKKTHDMSSTPSVF